MALGPAVDLDRGVEPGAGREDDLGIEDRPFAPAAGDLAIRDVADDVDVGAGDGHHQATRHVLARHAELAVHASDDDIEIGQQVVTQIECPVFEDVDLEAGQHSKGRHLLVQRSDFVELPAHARFVETVRDRQPCGMVGEHHVLVAERSCRFGHGRDGRRAVTPHRVHMAIAPQRFADPRAGADRYAAARFELGEIGRRAIEHRVGDHFARARADAVEFGERVVVRPLFQLVIAQRIDGRQCTNERPHLGGWRQLAIEVVDGL